MIKLSEQLEEPEKQLEESLDLLATIDPKSHLTLDYTINLVKAHSLVDSGAIGIFVHP